LSKILDDISIGAACLFGSWEKFSLRLGGRKLRPYQLEAGRAVLRSILESRGDTIVVMFPRQSGKNELQAHLEAYLLVLMQERGAEIVKVSPTWKPQTLNAMRRLERVLRSNHYTRGRYEKESGHIFRLGQARILFLSGSPTSNVMGATADVLLECDEAQDVLIEKWDREFAPMAASTNATCLFFGTAWTPDTLLARELRRARLAEQKDGVRRAFVLNADEVAREVPAYGRHVARQIEQLGRHHPFIKTQYFSEEISAAGGMFTAEHLQMMRGSHPAEERPHAGADYAFCFDLGGASLSEGGAIRETEEGVKGSALDGGREHDASALTILRMESTVEEDPLGGAPLYRVVGRFVWQNAGQRKLYRLLLGLAEAWQPRRIVLDASGMGAALSEFLGKALPGIVQPFVFTSASKSRLGWDFLALIENGRYKEYATQEPRLAELQELFFLQAQYCQREVLPGVERVLRWSVPQGARHPHTQRPLHDDLLVSAALCAALERHIWGPARSAVIVPPDPLESFGEVF
jgi:hypothetical protein